MRENEIVFHIELFLLFLFFFCCCLLFATIYLFVILFQRGKQPVPSIDRGKLATKKSKDLFLLLANLSTKCTHSRAQTGEHIVFHITLALHILPRQFLFQSISITNEYLEFSLRTKLCQKYVDKPYDKQHKHHQ